MVKETLGLQLQIVGREEKEKKEGEEEEIPTVAIWKVKKWWVLRAVCYAVLILSGQTAATLLGRLYYDKGGKSKWMSSLIQVAGIPILFPLFIISRIRRRRSPQPAPTSSSLPALASIYTGLGFLLALLCMLFSIGLKYLPVSTVALVSASQLGFTALFSFFMNSQKMTPAIVNSVVILTTSSVLLVFHGGGEEEGGTSSLSESKGKYAVGFASTLASAAGYAFSLSATQWSFRKVVKREDMGALVDMVMYPGVVATCVSGVGLFTSGEWRGVKGEMEGFELGGTSYVMTLVWTAVGWQMCTVGAMGFILEVSSLFSIVVGTLGVPIVPVLAALYFGETMNGAKVVSMVLALWGFVSFVYQHYLDGFSQQRRIVPPAAAAAAASQGSPV